MPVSPYVRKAVASAFVVALALSLSPAVAQADPGGQSTSTPGEQRYIVKYDDDVNAVEESESLEEGGVEVKTTLSHSMKASVVVANAAEIESIKMADNVASVELDSRVSVSSPTPLWGMDRIDQRSGRDGHYGMTDEGQGVDVYVVDSGLNLSHQDFSGRVPAGWEGIKDGIGLHDCRGHGTHVAGTIAGTASGVATRANIIPVRVIDCYGRGWASIVMAGIDWAIAHHPAGRPAVMNISLGNFVTSTMEQSLQSALNDGITVVVAAGNNNDDSCSTLPARFTPAITVAATDISDTQASFSSYGSCVDIYAPGVSIRSASNTDNAGYTLKNGTSMATPHVAGAAAVMLSRNNSLTPAQVQERLINDSTKDAVRGLKGSTPNRLLYIPAAAPLTRTSTSTPLAGETVDAVDTSGSLWSYSTPDGTMSARSFQGAGWGQAQQVIKADWNDDGILDIVARWGNGYLTMYAGTGNNGYSAPLAIGLGGWQNYDINAVKLKKTDRYPGLVARNVVTGDLYYYPNTTGGELTAPRTQIGFGGWSPMTEISALDLDADGNMDLIVRNPAGEILLYRTDGAGTILNEGRRNVDFGWNIMDHMAVQHNFAGAGTVGIIARNGNGYLFYYPIQNGKVQRPTIIGYGGWSGYKIAAGAPSKLS